jgi:hypothetical protein
LIASFDLILLVPGAEMLSPASAKWVASGMGAATCVLPLPNGIDDLRLKVAYSHLKAYGAACMAGLVING